MAKNKYFELTDEIRAVVKTAHKATSNEELAEIGKKMNIADEIYLGRVDLWLAKHAMAAVYKNLVKYPNLRVGMNYFGTLNGFVSKKDELFKKINPLCGNYIGQMVNKSTMDLAYSCRESFLNNGLAVAFVVGAPPFVFRGIIINGMSMREKNILAELENGERCGFAPRGCNTVKSVIDHEVGHIMDYLLGLSGTNEFRQYLSRYTPYELARGLSEYSAMGGQISPQETIAEAFSEYRNNENPRPIARDIAAYIESKYNQRYGGVGSLFR